jgi:cytochrome c-type biogenesis protein CcmH
VNRRSFLVGLPLGAAAARQAVRDTATGPADPLRDQSIIGRPRAVVTPADNLERVKNVERRLRCTCGCNLDIFTCRTTDFTCSVSPALHRDVMALFDAGKTPDEIVQAFVAKHGEAILMAPKPEGFNLVGYLLPSLALLLAGTVLGLFLLRQRGRLKPEPAPSLGPALTERDPTPEELERVQTSLREIR